MSYFYFICVCLHIVVSNTFCVAFLFSIVFILCLYSMLPVSLDCLFLIAPLVMICDCLALQSFDHEPEMRHKH
jgi:hypothetical protein